MKKILSLLTIICNLYQPLQNADQNPVIRIKPQPKNTFTTSICCKFFGCLQQRRPDRVIPTVILPNPEQTPAQFTHGKYKDNYNDYDYGNGNYGDNNYGDNNYGDSDDDFMNKVIGLPVYRNPNGHLMYPIAEEASSSQYSSQTSEQSQGQSDKQHEVDSAPG